ncbi:MAG: hypothetical protein LLG08_05445 [Actinomycetia bacterium]|nr:hypothetical protein [Actinomycetes bacterium]
MRRLALSVPDFGEVVVRRSLLDTFRHAHPSFAVLVAPSGYGKSILAAQIAGQPRFSRRIWVDASHLDLDADAAALLAEQLAADQDSPHFSPVGVACGPVKQRQDSQTLIGAFTAEFGGSATCLVIDGANSCSDISALGRISSVLLTAAGPDSCLVVTAREVATAGFASVLDAPFVLDSSVLRLQESEVAGFRELLPLKSVPSDLVELLRFCNGHAALFCVLASHPSFIQVIDNLVASDNVPLGVVVCLQHLVRDGLSDDQKVMLIVATLLGASTPGCISRLSGTHTSSRALRALADAVPLVRVGLGDHGPCMCVVHDLALVAVTDGTLMNELGESGRRAWTGALAELEIRGEFARIAMVLLSGADEDKIGEFIERCGSRMVLEGNLDVLRSLVDAVPIELRLQRPRLLVVVANMLRHSDRLDEAIEEALVAAELSLHYNAIAEYLESLLLLGKMYIDKGMNSEALEILRPVARYEDTAANDVVALFHGTCAHAQVGVGRRDLAEQHLSQVEAMLNEQSLSAAVRAQCLNWLAFMQAYVIGDMNKACSFLAKLSVTSGLPFASRLQAQGNLGTLRVEMGRISAAIEILSCTVDACRASGLVALAHKYEGSLAMAHAAAGQWEAAEELAFEGIERALALGYEYSASGNAVLRSVWRRAHGDLDGALADAEGVIGRMPEDAQTPIGQLACIECAATLLSMGEYTRSRLALQSIEDCLEAVSSAHHLLRADMVLAEIERQQGDFAAAVMRISQHAEYILTESANWQIAMYIRAFPGLLGVFSKAVGPDALPSHMLRIILPDYARSALDACGGELSSADMERLAVRLLGKRAATVYLRERASGPKAQVRLFGGMEVVTPGGTITDKDWRKRKARLLFALLVLRRGQDTPREQLFEHFWPEMDEDRAKSNFYVTWSIMKRALCAGAKDNGPCPYVEHIGGVCRIVPAVVSSDYAEFKDSLATMRKADRAGDIDLALAAAERIAQQYRGELLPGELYDDWLSPIRDRCRHDYGDAMLRASQLCFSAGDTEKALHLARAGLSQDPWREDLYQAALRYLIGSGQRSGAIETYMACKSKLGEDLGLDPSTETQRLYDQILAMEEPPSASAGA